MQNPKLLLFLFFICCQPMLLNAQSTLDELNQKAKTAFGNKDYHTAQHFFEEALILATNEKNIIEKAKSENNLGVTFWKTENYAESIHFYEKALSTYQLLDNDTLIASSHYNLGLALKKVGSNDLAIGHFSEAIKRFHKINDQKNEANVYNVLGNLHYNLSNYSKAIAYFENALFIYKRQNDQKSIATVYHNLAQVYLDTENQKEARYCLKKDRQIKTELELTTSSNSALYGKYYQRYRNIDSASYYYHLSFDERIENETQSKVALGYYHLGDFYLSQKKLVEAKDHLLKAYAISDSLALKPLKIEILELLICVNTESRNPALNNNLYPELMTLKDEALGKQNQLEIARFDIAFETVKKNNEIALKQQALAYEIKNNESLNIKNNFLTLIVILIILLVFIITLFYAKLRQKKIKLGEQNTELTKKNKIIEKLHRELNHRMGNYFQMFTGMLAFDITRAKNESEKELLQSNYNRINAMSQIQHYLLHKDKLTDDLVMLDFYLSNLTDEILAALNHDTLEVKIIKSLDTISTDYDKATRLGIALNELVQNAFKHGFKNSSHPTLNISLVNNKHNIQLIVADNGVGPQKETNTKRKSMGIELIRSLLSTVSGEIKYFNDYKEGMKIEIKIGK